ncbi:hypothetical protein GCM10020219_094770 [Nonomuraea dietziae]
MSRPVVSEIEVNLQELFFYSDEDASEEDSLLDGELLDLEPTFRDAVVLALRSAPCGRKTARGLCVDCGVKLAEAGPDHGHEKIDARWASLQGLISRTITIRRSDVAVPKRKMSRSNTRSRRAQWKTSAVALVSCPQCRFAQAAAHRVPDLRHLQPPSGHRAVCLIAQ